MAVETVDAGSGHPVFAGLALIEQGLAQVQEASTWSLDDRQVATLIVGLTQLGARTEAARGAALRESVSRETPDARGEQGARTVNLLKSRCRVSPRRASADVENAKLTCPDTGTLRELGRALAAGAVSREHVDVARSALKRLPGRVVRERRDEVDHLLTEHARSVRTRDGGVPVAAPAVGDHPGPRRTGTTRTPWTGGTCRWRPTRPGWSCSAASSTSAPG